jgi:hypothetical protein
MISQSDDHGATIVGVQRIVLELNGKQLRLLVRHDRKVGEPGTAMFMLELEAVSDEAAAVQRMNIHGAKQPFAERMANALREVGGQGDTHQQTAELFRVFFGVPEEVSVCCCECHKASGLTKGLFERWELDVTSGAWRCGGCRKES